MVDIYEVLIGCIPWMFVIINPSAGTSREFITLRPRQNGRHFADDTFKYIFLNENVIISVIISLKFVPKGPINNIAALVQIMAWHRSGDKPLSEPMVVRLPTHIYVTRPQWVIQVYTMAAIYLATQCRSISQNCTYSDWNMTKNENTFAFLKQTWHKKGWTSLGYVWGFP